MTEDVDKFFDDLLKRHISERNWVEVEHDFLFYGEFLEGADA